MPAPVLYTLALTTQWFSGHRPLFQESCPVFLFHPLNQVCIMMCLLTDTLSSIITLLSACFSHRLLISFSLHNLNWVQTHLRSLFCSIISFSFNKRYKIFSSMLLKLMKNNFYIITYACKIILGNHRAFHCKAIWEDFKTLYRNCVLLQFIFSPKQIFSEFSCFLKLPF